uniref:Protein trichome birefringence-like 1 n=1 Tax=Noccaea caerulescens TaxID=107243 RepID=A0A1J3F1S8_NOCCA
MLCVVVMSRLISDVLSDDGERCGLKSLAGKTSKREDYYQEGNNVHQKLNVDEAFRKALTTWGRWVDKNVNLSIRNTLVKLDLNATISTSLKL